MAAQLTPLPEVERLSPRCIRILGGNPGKFTLQGTNTYLVGTGARRLLVDTGEGMASWAAALRRTLAEEAQAQKPSAVPVTLDAVLITHWHPDHIGGIDQVRELVPDVKVYQRRRDDEPAGHGGAGAADAGVLDILDDHRFAVEGATLRAVHTPGHANNHMVFVLEEENAVLAGDNVLGQGTAVFEDLAVYLQSLARMRALYGDGSSGRKLYPAHGPVVEDGPAKISEYIAHRQQREDQVVQLLRGGETAATAAAGAAIGATGTAAAGTAARTPLQLVEIMYADVRRDLYDAAARGVLQILQKLESEGRVVQDGQGAWRWRDRSPL